MQNCNDENLLVFYPEDYVVFANSAGPITFMDIWPAMSIE